MKRIHLQGVIWLGFLGCMKEGCASVSTSGMVLLTHRGTHTMELNCSDQLTLQVSPDCLTQYAVVSGVCPSPTPSPDRCMLSAGCQQVSAVLCSLTGTLVSSVATWPMTDTETSQTLQSFGVEHLFWWWKPSASCFPTGIFHRVVFETEGGGSFLYSLCDMGVELAGCLVDPSCETICQNLQFPLWKDLSATWISFLLNGATHFLW